MTIKVIRPGKKDWKPLYRGTCHKCQCCLECSQEDGEYVGSFRSGLDGDFVKVSCPNCNDTIICYRVTEYKGSDDPREYTTKYWDR